MALVLLNDMDLGLLNIIEFNLPTGISLSFNMTLFLLFNMFQALSNNKEMVFKVYNINSTNLNGDKYMKYVNLNNEITRVAI